MACTPGTPAGTSSSPDPPQSQLADGTDGTPTTYPPGPLLPALDVATEPEAVALAGRVLAGGADGSAALREAILASGLAIHDNDEPVLLFTPNEPAQGLAFREYEMERMAHLESIGFTQPATELAEVVAAPLPELDGEPVAAMLLEGIRDSASDESPTHRFWAQFLIELGRQRDDGYDLLGQISADDVALDGVQTMFLIRRFQGDLLRVGATAMALRAVYRPYAHHEYASLRLGETIVAGRRSPCDFEDLDFNDPSAGDVMYDRLLALFPTTNAPRWRGAAGIIQAYAELLMSLEPSMENDLAGPEPFERTRTTEAGDIQELRTTVIWSLVPEQDVVDCMQAAINFMTGSSDITLELAGRVPDADVVYIVNADDPIALVDPTMPAPEHWLASTVTDEEGVATVWVVGRAQESDLPASAPQVVVEQEIDVRVSVEGADVWRGLSARTSTGGAGPEGARPVAPQLLSGIRFSFQSILVFGVADWGAHGYDVTIEFSGGGNDTASVGYTITGRLEPASGESDLESDLTGPAVIEGTYWGVEFGRNCFSRPVHGELVLVGDFVEGELLVGVTVPEDVELEQLERLPALFDLLMFFTLDLEGGVVEESREGQPIEEGQGIASCIGIADVTTRVTVSPDFLPSPEP